MSVYIQNQKVQFNTEPPETQVDKKHCPVEEQKETGSLKKDEACGKDTSKGMAGLCEYVFDFNIEILLLWIRGLVVNIYSCAPTGCIFDPLLLLE